MNKKRIIIHIVAPILLAIIANFVCMKLFYIPDPIKPNTSTWVTDAISVGISILTLAVSSIISAILYVGNKKK